MRRGFALWLLSVSFLCTSSANAAIISFFDTYDPTAIPFPSTALVSLSQFDPALGTLTQVTLTLDANTSGGSITFDNEALVESAVTLGIGAEVTAVGLAGMVATAVPLQTSSGSVDADNDAAADFVGTDSFSVVGGSGNDSDSAVLTAGLAPYIGTGVFDVEIAAAVENFLGTDGGFGPISQSPGVTDGTVTVIFEFIPIPEPSTALLLGFGLAGLGVRRRRGTA